MKLKEAVRSVWRYVGAFELALNYDPIADITLRVQRLESESQSQQSRLAALILEVQGLRNAS